MWYIPPGNPYNRRSFCTHFKQIILKRRSTPHFDYRGVSATQMVEILDNPSRQAIYQLPKVAKSEKLSSSFILISDQMKNETNATMILNHFDTEN